jgi:hypothetical protein
MAEQSKVWRNPRRGGSVGAVWPSAVFENFYEKAGNDPDQLEIWCYSNRLSYAPGETLRLHISTTAVRYDLTIVRDGARPQVVHRAEGLSGRFYPAPADCSVAGCGWPVEFELAIPPDWRSGGYLVEAVARGQDGAAFAQHHLFLVRAAAGEEAPLLLVAATGTWTAYNDWGGSNHYEGITGPEGKLYSPVLSLDRPLSRGFVCLPPGAPRVPPREALPPGAPPRYPHMEWAYANGFSKKYASAGWASYERPFVCWLEEQGYRVDLASLTDLHFNPNLLNAYKCVLFVGHDEYWSWDMRDAVDAYLEGGGRVARFAGNFLWQIRLEDEGRTQVCYKYRARAEDPFYGGPEAHLTTNCWEAPEVGRPGALTFGLNARSTGRATGPLPAATSTTAMCSAPSRGSSATRSTASTTSFGTACRLPPTTAAPPRAWRSSPWALRPTWKKTTATRTTCPSWPTMTRASSPRPFMAKRAPRPSTRSPAATA